MVHLTSRLLPALSDSITAFKPQAVLAQGDTVSVFAAALVAYYANVPFGHVEAGLRTRDIQAPFPEEGFRQMAARVTRWHFAPTQSAAANLLNEGVSENSISVTGNTGIDALMLVAAKGGDGSDVGTREASACGDAEEQVPRGRPGGGVVELARLVEAQRPGGAADVEGVEPGTIALEAAGDGLAVGGQDRPTCASEVGRILDDPDGCHRSRTVTRRCGAVPVLPEARRSFRLAALPVVRRTRGRA